MKAESEIQQEIQIAGPRDNCQLMRNNSGALCDESGRSVRFGLGNISKEHSKHIKSSDLIGFTEIKITQEMVGRTIAVFTACEVKKQDWKFNPKDKRECAQKAFIDWVTSRGGIAGFANSVDSFRKILGL